MKRYYLDLFSGIGGFALGAYWAGMKFDGHFFAEIDNYAIKLYQKRFPDAELLGDVKEIDYAKLPKGEWYVTGGFPCQPHSLTGLRKGAEDERNLWPACTRMLRQLRPKIAVFENVRGIFTSPGKEQKGEFFNGVLSDIYKSGYDAEWQVISAQDVGAPHKRERVWIICWNSNSSNEIKKQCLEETKNTKSNGACKIISDTVDTTSARQRKHSRKTHERTKTKRFIECCSSAWWATEPSICFMVDGLPSGMDRYEGRISNNSYKRLSQLKGLGNAIVPQIALLLWLYIQNKILGGYDEKNR